MSKKVVVIGGGLAGCECAFTLARYGVHVFLYDQKPQTFSPAHTSRHLGELVCSNSFRSDKADGPQSSGVGILKQEMRSLESTILQSADQFKVPAGKALAVDRELFAKDITARIEDNPNITLSCREIKSVDEIKALQDTHDADYAVIASGPLTADSLAESLGAYIGTEHCYFYDAIAPIIAAESVNTGIVFRGSRYDNFPPPPYNDEIAHSKEMSLQWREQMAANNSLFIHDSASSQKEPFEGGDYINCPMHKFEYEVFYNGLLQSQKIPSRDFEKEIHFEGCMPIEALAERGERTLTFGTLKPVGFTDPRTGRRPYAVLQLRTENIHENAYNLVGCQTKMTYASQDEVFRLVPGLENVEFLRYGSMHRNTYVNAPNCLNAQLALLNDSSIFLAGQITGVEGYVESAACGLWVGIQLAAILLGKNISPLPQTTALGALMAHTQNTSLKNYQPSNAHFGLMPSLEGKNSKKNRKEFMAERAKQDFDTWHAGFLEETVDVIVSE